MKLHYYTLPKILYFDSILLINITFLYRNRIYFFGDRVFTENFPPVLPKIILIRKWMYLNSSVKQRETNSKFKFNSIWGFIISSVSMILHSHNKLIDRKASNPETLNAWLLKHNGYTVDNRFKWNAVDPLFFTNP